VLLRPCRLAGLMALIFAQGLVSASAQQVRTQIGLLTCRLTSNEAAQGQAENVPLRQTRELLCAFRPASGGPEETYTGTLQSVGLEQELSENRTLIWIVSGTRETVESPGLLQQVYAADLTANPGHSPRMLQSLADSGAPALNDSELKATIAMVVVVSLILKSAPA
jgi:Protein of unknown function (DUF992)